MSVTTFRCYANRFAGSLPHSGMRAMMAITTFVIIHNSFTGALPEGGVRAMVTLTAFEISVNCFTGALPDGGLRTLQVLGIFQNRLVGMLPDGIFLKAIPRLFISDNFFTGTVAESLPRTPTREQALASSHNTCIPGFVPPKFFGSSLHSRRTLPAALIRLSHASWLALSHNCFEGFAIKHGCDIELQEQSQKRL
eukprot:6479335-Amphidinium_carterae.1